MSGKPKDRPDLDRLLADAEARLFDRVVLIEDSVDLGDRPGAGSEGAKAMSSISAMVLGADCIDDYDVLRAGRTADLVGHRVLAPSTLGTFLRAFTFGHVRRLDRALGQLLARAWATGAGPGDGRLIVDLDSFVGEVFGTQGAAFGPTRVRGLHPILATRGIRRLTRWIEAKRPGAAPRARACGRGGRGRVTRSGGRAPA